MYYIYLQNNIAYEIIPEYSSDFPGIPIEKRYAPEFLKQCVKWDTEVPQGWIYDEEANTFTPPPEPEPIEVIPPTLDEAKRAKLSELSDACEATIYAGVSVKTTQGMENFAMTLEDQTNIGNLMLQAQMGSPVLYHADGELCRWFEPDEFKKVAQAVIVHKTYHTTLCNHLNTWVRRTDDTDELAAIRYDSKLPKDLADHMNELLNGTGDVD